jgi:hypothetical protein
MMPLAKQTMQELVIQGKELKGEIIQTCKMFQMLGQFPKVAIESGLKRI